MTTKKEIGIAYNIAVEVANDFSLALEIPPFTIINETAEWLIAMYAKEKKGTSSLEKAYTVAAAIRAVSKMARDNNIYQLTNNGFEYIDKKDLTLDICFTLANLITQSTLNKLI